MSSATDTTFDATGWSARWEAQQAGYVPDRDRVFGLMLDVVERLGGVPSRVLDLGCGPGSLAGRVVERFGDAEVVAVDFDPAMLELGRRTLGDRVRWVRADLTDPGWVAQVGGSGFDAAVSATALHWLPAGHLGTFAAELAGRIRPGGVFQNFDTLLPDTERTPRLGSMITELRRERTQDRTGGPDFEDFWSWWDAAGRDPVLSAGIADRAPDYGSHGGSSLGQWERALHGAGFSEVTTLTQLLDRRLLVGLR